MILLSYFSVRMNTYKLAAHNTIAILTILCCCTQTIETTMSEDSELISDMLSQYYDVIDSADETELKPREENLLDVGKGLKLLYLLHYGPLLSGSRNDYFSVVNKRTRDVMTSVGTYDRDTRVLGGRKRGDGSAFSSLLNAARIMDKLENSSSFHPWAG